MRKLHLIPLAGLAVALTLTLAACGPYALAPQEQQAAELGARQYAERLSADFVACSGQDSDRDGYVTCAVKDRARGAVSDIVCSYSVSGGALSAGCKRK